MNIIELTEDVRGKVKARGRYQDLACDGLTYHWIQKFACGQIKNPTVENLAKLVQALEKEQAA